MKRLLVEPELCTGCRLCQMVCSFHHLGKYGLSHSGVRVVEDGPEGLSYPVVCLQCEERYCEHACPVGAIAAGKIDEDLCIGCLECVRACPYGCIFARRRGVPPLKCSVCLPDPPCTRICPTGALRLVEDNLEVRRRLSAVGKELVRLAGGGSGGASRHDDGSVQTGRSGCADVRS